MVTSFLYHVSAMRGTTLVARLLLCLHFLMKTSKNRNGAFQQDHARAIELYTRAAEFGSSILHQNLGDLYHNGGNMKKAKFYYEAAAMAGQAGHYIAMYQLRTGVLKKAMLVENQSTQFWKLTIVPVPR